MSCSSPNFLLTFFRTDYLILHPIDLLIEIIKLALYFSFSTAFFLDPSLGLRSTVAEDFAHIISFTFPHLFDIVFESVFHLRGALQIVAMIPFYSRGYWLLTWSWVLPQMVQLEGGGAQLCCLSPNTVHSSSLSLFNGAWHWEALWKSLVKNIHYCWPEEDQVTYQW